MAKPVRHGNGWRVRPYDENGNRFSEVYPTFKDASFALERYRTHANEIKRGIRSPTPPKKTFDELCDYYLKYYSSQKRNLRADQTNINAHLRLFFGKYQLKEVAQHIALYKLEHGHLSKKTLHNHLTLLITMLRVAHFEKKWLLELPQIKKPRIKLCDKDFNFLKTDDEIRRFLLNTREESEVAFNLYATAIYTGMRAGELAGLLWEDVNFERRLICVRRSYNGPTKNEETRHVPILDVLLSILKEWRLLCPGKVVFPNQRGTSLGPSARLFQEVFQRVLKRAAFPKIEKNGKIRQYVVFHDLRHTFASHWMMKGGDVFRLQKILGHSDTKMTQRYSHLAPHIYAEDYSRFGNTSPCLR